MKSRSLTRLSRRLAPLLLTCLLLAVAAAPAAAMQGWQAPVGLFRESPRLAGAATPSAAVMPVAGAADIVSADGDLVGKAAGSSWGLPVNVAKASRISGSQVATDDAGDLFAVWFGRGSSECDPVVRAAAKPARGSWSAPVTIWEATGSCLDEPSTEGLRIVADPAGDLVALWHSWFQRGARQSTIWAASKPAAGSWSTAQALSPSTQQAEEAELAIDPAGNATAVWHGVGEIFATSRPAGGSWSEPAPISAPGESTREPAIALDRAGEALAAWCASRGEASEGTIEVSSRSTEGSWSAPESISPPGRKPLQPRIALDPAGNATAAWLYQWTGSVQATYRPVGGSWGEPVRVSEEGRKGSGPVLAVNAGGDAVVAWTADREAGHEVVQAAIRPRGSGWQPAATLSAPATTIRGTSIPVVAIDRAGNAVVAWSDVISQAAQAADYFASPQPLPAPNLLGSEPRSPADDNSPVLWGSAPAGSTIALFTNSTCWGTPIATSGDAGFASPGIAVRVRDNTTTSFYATASQGGETSSCSGPLNYTESSGPVTMPEALASMLALDPFTTPEDPLSRGGAWSTLRGAGGPGFVSATGWGAHEQFPAVASAYWAASTFLDTGTGDAASARLVASPGVVKRYFSLWLDMPRPATNKTGYELRFTEVGNNDYNAELKSWKNGSATTLATVEDVVLPVGGYFALADRGSNLSIWVDAGAGYVNLASVTDGQWGSGFAGIATNGNGARLRRFAAAPLPIVSP